MPPVGVIFDDGPRPETTGQYALRALQCLTDAVHLRPADLPQVDPNRFRLFLRVDDGLEYDIPPQLRPLAWWGIDTHLAFDRCLKQARQADFVFAAQKNGAERLRQAGIPNVRWLPLACDPVIHGRRQVENRFDVAFVGNFFPGARTELLNLLREKIPRCFLGQCDYREMAEIYSASKIVFNRSIQDDVNMRVFEGLCSGSLLFTNHIAENGQEELFQTGVHAETYQDADELFDQIHYYLTHDSERERIAAAGRELALQQHTYRHRMEQVLQQVSPLLNRTSVILPATPNLKDHSYFEFDRPDVLEHVPSTARHILDIGCGGGRLGEAIKRRQAAHVTGIELNSNAAEAACQRLDDVYIGNVQSEGIDFPEGTFDCVICADVLEHLRDPAAVLKKIRRWLTPEGMLVTSLPNVRNHTVIRSLLAGNWTYESAGLLDEDHVRFFTRREIEKLLFRCGFDVQELRAIGGPGFAEWEQQGCPPQVTIGPLSLQVGSQAEAAEFFAYQFLTTATPQPVPNLPFTSIILVTFNQWGHTKACLDSIRLLTDESYEIIVVDNGSTDGTVEFLRSAPDVRLIANGQNRGFPAAANQGILAAQGEQVLLLNNDTLVTTGWLSRLTAALYSVPGVGLVGPVTNHISGEQQVPVPYDDLAQLDGFAWDWGKQHHRQYQPTDRLVGFCLLIKRELIDRIGLLDERFGIGNFEDDDYCRRACEAGYRCLIAQDTFIHHTGSATFRGSGTDLNALLQTNHKLYQEKWNERGQGPEVRDQREKMPRRVGYHHFLLEANENGELLLKPNPIKLSACLIVRDNESTIRPCLESLRPWVDELIVVDTGSKDRTPEICEALGATVHHWPWRDSFSLARNESFRQARGEWIFWMDSDDTLPEHCGQKLRELVNGDHPENCLGYLMQVHCPGLTPQDVTAVDHVKLIRNRPDLEWEFHIHEQILPSIRRAGGDVAWTDLYVVHSGSDHSEASHIKKLQRDFHLLHRDLAERPDHPFVLFNLGMTHADAGQHNEAIQSLQRCLQVSGKDESHLRKAYALLIGSLMQLPQTDEAQHCCTQGLRLFPDDKELLFRQAMLFHAAGRLKQAEQTYLRILQEQTPRHFASVDLGITDYKTRHNLAIVYEDLGQPEIAQQIWNDILIAHPDYEPAFVSLQRMQQAVVPAIPSGEVSS